jgi:hypothetical protein
MSGSQFLGPDLISKAPQNVLRLKNTVHTFFKITPYLYRNKSDGDTFRTVTDFITDFPHYVFSQTKEPEPIVMTRLPASFWYGGEEASW